MSLHVSGTYTPAIQHTLQSHHWSQIHTGYHRYLKAPIPVISSSGRGITQELLCSFPPAGSFARCCHLQCSSSETSPMLYWKEVRNQEWQSTSGRGGAGSLWGPSAAHGQVMARFSRNRDHFLCSAGSRAGRWARRGTRRKRQDASISLKQIKYQKAAGSFETACLLFWQRRKASH